MIDQIPIIARTVEVYPNSSWNVSPIIKEYPPMVTQNELLQCCKDLLALLSSEPPKDNAAQITMTSAGRLIRLAEQEAKEFSDVQKAAERGFRS